MPDKECFINSEEKHKEATCVSEMTEKTTIKTELNC